MDSHLHARELHSMLTLLHIVTMQPCIAVCLRAQSD